MFDGRTNLLVAFPEDDIAVPQVANGADEVEDGNSRTSNCRDTR